MLLLLLLKVIFNTNIFVVCILGGNEIDIDEAPYQVNYGDVCGGVLIHKKWVTTTAHCGKKDYVRVGNKHRLGGSKVKISRYIVHPLFGKKHEFDYDIQLLELHRSLKVTNKVQPINITNGTRGGYVYVAGWGYPKEKGDYQDTLQRVKLKLVQFKECQDVKQPWYNHTLTDRMFCAGGNKSTDACQGDSGGGAVFGGYLAGISSFGYGCGRDIPGVYINVSDTNIRGWINYYTGL